MYYNQERLLYVLGEVVVESQSLVVLFQPPNLSNYHNPRYIFIFGDTGDEKPEISVRNCCCLLDSPKNLLSYYCM